MITDIEEVIEQIASWLLFRMTHGKKEGMLIHLDGTLNSAVLASICKDRFPGGNKAIVLPVGGENSNKCADRCINFINHSQINYEVYDLNKAWLGFPNKIIGNYKIQSKVRSSLFHTTLNGLADLEDKLLLKSADKGELDIEYPNEYHTMGLCPLGQLYRSEIVAIAKYYNVPEEIIKSPVSHNLYLGQSLEKELDITPDELEWACRTLDKGDQIDTSKLSPRRQIVINTVSKLKTNKFKKYNMSSLPPLVRNSKLLK